MLTEKCRVVEVIPGNVTGIRTRATQITDMGDDMIEAAVMLKGIEDGTHVGVGYTMDKIREVVGDAHRDLDEAGRRYKPNGTALADYADALERAQREMSALVEACTTSQSLLEQAEEDERSASIAHSNFQDRPPLADDASDHQRESDLRRGNRLREAAENAATSLSTARTNHSNNLDDYDDEWDLWHEAYETAVSRMSDANEIGKDSWQENVSGWAAGIGEVLGWVGLGLAVLGLIVGGPFIAFAALVVGVVALAMTILQTLDGRKGIFDVLWGVVGILPIGKLGMLFKSGQRLKFVGEFGRQFTKPFQQFGALRGLNVLPRNNWKSGTQAAFNAYMDGIKGVRMTGPFSLAGLGQRFLGGTNRSFSAAMSDAIGSQGAGFIKRFVNSDGTAPLAALLGSKPTLLEQGMNVFKWTDRVVSLTTEQRPSGTLSPAGFLNGIFR